MRTIALVLFGVAIALASATGPSAAFGAPVPKHLMKEPEGEKAKLQGKWKVEAIKMGGNDILGVLGQNFDMVVEFQGNAFVATANFGGTFRKTTATLKHDSGAEAKQFTTTETATVDKDGQTTQDGKDASFTYAFDGGKLFLASGANGGAAKPPADPLKPGPNDVVMVLVRVK